MTPVSEERRAAYFNQAIDDHVGAVAELDHSAGNGAPLEPISEAAEFAADANEKLPSQVERRPAGRTVSAASSSRRPSMLTEVRRLSQAAPRASWNCLRLSTATAVSYLTPRMTVYSSDTLQGMPWRARMDFYVSQPEDSSIGWFIQSTMMVILVVNIAVMAGETLDGPRYGSSDPGYTFLPGKTAFVLADAGFTAVYVLEFAVRSIVARHPTQYWKSWATWINVLALLPFFIHIGLDALNKNNSDYSGVETEDRVSLLRVFRVVRLVSLSRMFLGTKILFRVSKKVVAPLKITVRVS